MSQIHPQTWQRNSVRQILEPYSTQLWQFIGLAAQYAAKVFRYRMSIHPSIFVLSRGIRPNIKAGILGGIVVMLYRTIILSGMITDIPDLIYSQQVQPKILTKQSGYARSVDQALIPLDAPSPVIGDDDQDQQVKLFLTYDLSKIPQNTRIDLARLSFKCTMVGNISEFGDLSVHTVAFEGYSEDIFDSFPLDDNSFRARIFLVGNMPLFSGCNSGRTIAYSNTALAQMVESQISAGKINLVMYFEDDSILANRQADGIKIDTLPQLDVVYSR